MTLPELALREVRATLDRQEFVPAGCLAIFVGGSFARGWQHARSDADLYLVSDRRWDGESNGFNPVGVDPDTVPTNVTYIDELRWELRYWTDRQVDQVFAKVGWDVFEQHDSLGQRIGDYEAALLSRLEGALVIDGEDWLRRRREELAASAFRSVFSLRALAEADSYVEDSLGMMESGDAASAVLAAQAALGASVDALVVNKGEYGTEPKWRARRIEAIDSPILPFDRYWELTTMQTFDPQRPEEWIESVLELCRRVALEVEI